MKSVAYLDDGDHVSCRLFPLAWVNVKVCELVLLAACVDNAGPLPHGPDAP